MRKAKTGIKLNIIDQNVFQPQNLLIKLDDPFIIYAYVYSRNTTCKYFILKGLW